MSEKIVRIRILFAKKTCTIVIRMTEERQLKLQNKVDILPVK
jgi:hypothetical protein